MSIFVFLLISWFTLRLSVKFPEPLKESNFVCLHCMMIFTEIQWVGSSFQLILWRDHNSHWGKILISKIKSTFWSLETNPAVLSSLLFSILPVEKNPNSFRSLENWLLKLCIWSDFVSAPIGFFHQQCN